MTYFYASSVFQYHQVKLKFLISEAQIGVYLKVNFTLVFTLQIQVKSTIIKIK
jgi:hypothetical protein